MCEYYQEGLSVCTPISNLWIGVTAENQEWADKRIPELLKIPAAVRFASYEPVLAECDFQQYLDAPKRGGAWPDSECKLDWLIVGPETGAGRRECEPEWIQSVIEQCDAAGVPVFVKAFPMPDGGISKDMSEWPEWARRRGFPEAKP